jgi:DNA-binding transcriptional MerR regulator
VAKTSPRTVRYYVQRGLLPAPIFRGKDTAYGREHLVRLRAIRRLQEAFFPLEAIAAELARRSMDEVERIADGTELPAPPASGVVVEEPEPPRVRQKGVRDASPVGRVFERVELASGLELHVAADASPEAKRLAGLVLKLMRNGNEEEGV